MEDRNINNSVDTIGLDITKSSFSAHRFDAGGRTVLTKVLKQHQPFLKYCAVKNQAKAKAP